jgi:hypothetical protein
MSKGDASCKTSSAKDYCREIRLSQRQRLYHRRYSADASSLAAGMMACFLKLKGVLTIPLTAMLPLHAVDDSGRRGGHKTT